MTPWVSSILVIERHLQGKVFYFVPSFQNSMRESSSGAENYKKDGNMCSKTVSRIRKLISFILFNKINE